MAKDLEEMLASLRKTNARPQSSKSTRRRRRREKALRDDRLLRIINYGGYHPNVGYVDWGFDGKTLLHSGKYIKYPKNSSRQNEAKRISRRAERRCEDAPVKGNYYRRLFSYWWYVY